jgi:hypothetical protein
LPSDKSGQLNEEEWPELKQNPQVWFPKLDANLINKLVTAGDQKFKLLRKNLKSSSVIL